MKNINIQKLKTFTLLLFCFFLYATSLAQVGIETNDPTTPLDVNGSISLKEGQQLTMVDGNNNNINLGSTPFSFYRITGPTTSFNITGVVPLNAADGQIVTLQNDTNAIMNIIDASVSGSVAANRIIVPNRKDFQVRGKYASVTLQYIATTKRWTIVNGLNNVQTWYTQNLVRLIDGRKTTLTVNGPFITSTSGVSVNIVNATGLPDAEKYNIIVEYVEVNNGYIIVRFNNKNAQTSGWCQPNGNFCSFVDILPGLTFYVN